MRHLICRLLGEIYRIDLDGKENLKVLRDHLEEGSAIIVFNHISLDDMVILLVSLLPEIGEKIERMVAPGSRRHWGEPLLGWMMRLGFLLGLEVLPIVRHYERERYDSIHVFHLDRQFVEIAHQVLAGKGE